jgi:hypothetical protein
MKLIVYEIPLKRFRKKQGKLGFTVNLIQFSPHVHRMVIMLSFSALREVTQKN